jgi:hypothetical protein
MLPGRGPENIPGNFFSLSSGQLASCSSCGLRCERALLASSALSSVRINRFNSEHVSKSPGMSRLPHTYGCTKSALTGTESTTVPLHLRKSYTYICRSCLATHRRQRPCGFACLRISTQPDINTTLSPRSSLPASPSPASTLCSAHFASEAEAELQHRTSSHIREPGFSPVPSCTGSLETPAKR